MFVVAGVTGKTGSIVAEALIERRQGIRVIVRRPEQGAVWQAKGAEVAVASLDDPDALVKAFDGAAGAYLLIPPNYNAPVYLEDRKKIVDALARAVEGSALPHAVFLSSVGAHLPAGTGPILVNRYGEQRLGPVARNMTVLRPAYFMDNWAAVLGAARDHGVLPSFLTPDRKIATVSTRDIGRFAAEALLNPPKGRRVLELAGPADYSPEDVALAVGQRLHRAVKVLPQPLGEVVPTLTSVGFSEDAARLFQDMYAGIEKGQIAFEGNGAARPRGLVTISEAVSAWI